MPDTNINIEKIATPPPLTKTATYTEPDPADSSKPLASFTMTLTCRPGLVTSDKVYELTKRLTDGYVVGRDGFPPEEVTTSDGTPVPMSESLCSFIASLMILDASPKEMRWEFIKWAQVSVLLPNAFAQAAMDAGLMIQQAIPLAKKG